MSCPPIIHRDASLNNVSTQLHVLEKKVFHLQNTIGIMDNALREGCGLDMEITKCQLEAIKQLRHQSQQNTYVENEPPEGYYEIALNDFETEVVAKRNSTLNWRILSENIDERICQLREDFLFNYDSLIRARPATFINGRLVVLDEQKRLELMQTYEQKLDKKLLKSREALQIDDSTDLNQLKNELKENFRKQRQEYDEISTRKEVLTMREIHLRESLNPQFEALEAEKRRLLSQLEACDIFTACQLNDDEFLEQELAKLGTWNILTRPYNKKTFVNQIHADGFTPLHSACYHNHVEIVRILLENGANETALDRYQYQPIHWAAKQGAYTVVQYLLDGNNKKSLINARGEYGRTPLHMSVFNGRDQTTRLLIASGANINAQTNLDEQLLTPLHYAVSQENIKMVEILTSYANLNVCVKDSSGFTPLYYAVSNGQACIVECLLNHKSWSNPSDAQDPNSLESLVEISKRKDENEIQRLLFLKFPAEE